MNLMNMKRPFLSMLLLVIAFSFAQAQTQQVSLKDLAETHKLDIKKDTGGDLNWGETVQGKPVRAKVEFTNTFEKPITLVRVIAESGCYPIGNRLALRDVKIEPGATQDFFLITKADQVGDQSFKIELIIEDEKGKRARKAVFNFTGSVAQAEQE